MIFSHKPFSFQGDSVLNHSDDTSARSAAEIGDELWLEALRRGERMSLTIASASMSPTLEKGDRITVEPYPPGLGPRVGDIVLFRIDERWVAHRVVGRAGSGADTAYRQKGDADHRSVLAPAAAVAGRVVTVRRGTRSIALDAPRQRILQRLLGLYFYTIDRCLRAGSPAGGGTTGAGRPASGWRLPAAKMLAASRRAFVAAIARLSNWGNVPPS